MVNKVYYVIISCGTWTPANKHSQKLIFTSKYLCDVDIYIGLDFAFSQGHITVYYAIVF